MNYTFKQLKKKNVINLANGKQLGKVIDVTVNYPNNCFINLIVSNCSGLFSDNNIVIDVCSISKIGEDAILVNYNEKQFCDKKVEDIQSVNMEVEE